MRLAELIGRRHKDVPKDAVLPSHQLLVRGGYMRQVAAGIYSILPLGKRVLAKIEAVIRAEMDGLGGQEVLLPVVMPRELWEESGRYASIDAAMARFKDRGGKDLVLGMTHEEAVVALARSEATSYRQYPFVLYQIQTKFRDEVRSRGGLVRVREFTMKDAYSFHTSAECLQRTYDRCYGAYERIFARVGLRQTLAVQSDTGMMGGKIAHEFMLLNPHGEDSLAVCAACGYAANVEVATRRPRDDGVTGPVVEGDGCPRCTGFLTLRRGIEIGNIFQLGDRYTKAMGMHYRDETGVDRHPVMGCYGIGVGRLMAAVVEDNHDERGPCWPAAVAPFAVQLCAIGGGAEASVRAAAATLMAELAAGGVAALLDDGDDGAGVQFANADLIGCPWRLVLSPRGVARGVVELRRRDGAVASDVPLATGAAAVIAEVLKAPGSGAARPRP